MIDFTEEQGLTITRTDSGQISRQASLLPARGYRVAATCCLSQYLQSDFYLNLAIISRAIDLTDA